MKLDVKYVIDQYVNFDRAAKNIAKELGCSEKSISQLLRRNSIPTKRRSKQNLKQNLLGQKFGQLTILALAGTDKNGDNLWLCSCKCGSEKTIIARSFLRIDSPINSCGCTRTKGIQWKTVPPWFISSIRSKAKNRGIDFNISVEYCNDLFHQQNAKCALSGIQLVFNKRRSKAETNASLDRIDSSLAYQEDNVQWVTKQINIMKHVLSDVEFINLCKIVSEHNK